MLEEWDGGRAFTTVPNRPFNTFAFPLETIPLQARSHLTLSVRRAYIYIVQKNIHCGHGAYMYTPF